MRSHEDEAALITGLFEGLEEGVLCVPGRTLYVAEDDPTPTALCGTQSEELFKADAGVSISASDPAYGDTLRSF
jgi:hypothetical protein